MLGSGIMSLTPLSKIIVEHSRLILVVIAVVVMVIAFVCGDKFIVRKHRIAITKRMSHLKYFSEWRTQA